MQFHPAIGCSAATRPGGPARCLAGAGGQVELIHSYSLICQCNLIVALALALAVTGGVPRRLDGGASADAMLRAAAMR